MALDGLQLKIWAKFSREMRESANVSSFEKRGIPLRGMAAEQYRNRLVNRIAGPRPPAPRRARRQSQCITLAMSKLIGILALRDGAFP